MVTQLTLGEIAVDVVLKDIKNVHLSVYPPTGRVRISAPRRMSLDKIRVFAISKLSWIKQQQKKFKGQERETPREYLDRESHYLWGKRYLLMTVPGNGLATVELTHSRLILRVASGTSHEAKEATISRWYREQVRAAAPHLIAKWEPIIGVKVRRIFVQKMKTRWGSCNQGKQTIRLNTDLAKKPRQCIEYIVVHEMVHLLERNHNDRFRECMDRILPHWRLYRAELNRIPLSHENWTY